MHTNAAQKLALGYAVIFGRGGSLARHMAGLFMAMLMMLGVAAQAQAATIRATFEFGSYASVGHNNAWCSGTDAGIVMRCAVQNWAGSGSIVNSCVETSRYIAPGSLGIGGNTFGGYVYGTCNVHTISPPQDSIFKVSANSSIWVALQNIPVCPTDSTWTGDATYTCTCNANFKPDSTITKCIPITPLTIALHNLNVGGELAPSASRQAYAQVMNGTIPQGGTVVTLTSSAPFEAGSLTLSPPSGVTDGLSGRLNFIVTAPPSSRTYTHTLTATCTNCSNAAKGAIVVSACPIQDLPPITDVEVQDFEDNPGRSDTTRLSDRMKTALACLKRDAAAGSPSVGSAFRPPAYNQHLIDVWEKWIDELKDEEDMACADLKTKIRGHFQQHKLLESQPPVPSSRHTRGEAVDVTINLPPATIDTLAAGCQLSRPLPVKDRVHFIHQ